MELTGGTTKVNRLIKDLQADGSLLNFYSESVFDNPKINEIHHQIPTIPKVNWHWMMI